VKGAELELSVYPVHGLTFDASFSYLDFKYTSATTPDGLLAGTDIPASGITPYTPKTQWSFGGQYDHDTPLGTFSARLDGSYQGKLFTNAENTYWGTVDGRFLANARLSWSDLAAKWRASLEVQNLFDKYYFISVSDITTSLGAVTGVPGKPRTYAASIERRF
jgi:iron complex outermembrane receptor protein